MALVEKGQAYEEATNAAIKSIKDEKTYVREAALDLLEKLSAAAATGIKDEDEEVRLFALKLKTLLQEKGKWKEVQQKEITTEKKRLIFQGAGAP